MNNRELVEIIDSKGKVEQVQLVTYLISDDKLSQYIVYTKNEIRNNNEHVIYISRLYKVGDEKRLDEISDDREWLYVQSLLKRIANKN